VHKEEINKPITENINDSEHTPSNKSQNKNGIIHYIPTVYEIPLNNKSPISQSPEIDPSEVSSLTRIPSISNNYRAGKETARVLFESDGEIKPIEAPPCQPAPPINISKPNEVDEKVLKCNSSHSFGDQEIFKLISSFKIIPKTGEKTEDYCFIHERAMGVADGVSGWNAFGLNASEFSCSLMTNANNTVLESLKNLSVNSEWNKTKLRNIKSFITLTSLDPILSNDDEKPITFYSKILNPLDILTQAYSKVSAIGSSTACVCVINGNKFECCNLGDSGFIIFRKDANGHYILKDYSRDQQHEFNTPYQLSNLPQKEHYLKLEKEDKVVEANELRKAMENSKLCHDLPPQSDHYSITLVDKDIVILATDGVLDNLFLSEIKKIIEATIKNKKWEFSKIGAKVMK
jgi:serine/threonine protein phosphatase PrpC